MLIRVHDSADDGRARLSFHTSFDNPLAPNAPTRESIEVRTLVFFPGELKRSSFPLAAAGKGKARPAEYCCKGFFDRSIMRR